MLELVKFITEKVLNHPDEVEITEEETSEIHQINISTHPDDTGIMIGKKGRTASAIREILKVKGMGSGKRILLEITSQE